MHNYIPSCMQNAMGVIAFQHIFSTWIVHTSIDSLVIV
jgi:hypothetical protein